MGKTRGLVNTPKGIPTTGFQQRPERQNGVAAEATVIDIKKSGRNVTIIGRFVDKNGTKHTVPLDFPSQRELLARIPIVYLPSAPETVYAVQGFQGWTMLLIILIINFIAWLAFWAGLRSLPDDSLLWRILSRKTVLEYDRK